MHACQWLITCMYDWRRYSTCTVLNVIDEVITHTEMPTLYQPCTNHVQTMYKPCTNPGFEIVPRWLHGCSHLLTTLQPMGNLVTTLCQGGSKLGRLLLPSHGLVTSLAFLYMIVITWAPKVYWLIYSWGEAEAVYVPVDLRGKVITHLDHESI